MLAILILQVRTSRVRGQEVAKLGVRPRRLCFKAQALSHLGPVWGLSDQWVWTSRPLGSFPELTYLPWLWESLLQGLRAGYPLAKWASGADVGASLAG